MKVRTLLVAAVMFLALSAAAFAQATFQVGSIPVTTVASTGNTELTGDITFTMVSGSNATILGTINVTYPVPITVVDFPDYVQIINNTLVGAATAPQIKSVSKTGTVVITVPADATSGSFTLTGVRVQIADTGFTNVGLTASISAVNNAILAGQTVVTVVNQIAAPLTAGDAGTADTVNSVTGKIYDSDGAEAESAIMSAAENYLDAFGKTPDTDPTLTTGRMIKFVLTPPPAGVTLTMPETAALANSGGSIADGFELVDSTGVAVGDTVDITSDSSSFTVYYKLVTDSDPTLSEWIEVVVGISTKDASLPIPSGTVTYTASMAPIGPAFDSKGNPIPESDTTHFIIPRFKDVPIAAQTLLSVAGSTTTLLIPYAGVTASSGFDTGLAVANTTTDPNTDSETSITGITSPVVQEGTVTFYFYQQQVGTTAPTTFSYTTKAGSPGNGVDANGLVPSGSTYVVLLTQLLNAAGVTGDFAGYIFVVTNFTNAHAQYVLTDFKSFANGGQGLVIATDRSATPEVLGQ